VLATITVSTGTRVRLYGGTDHTAGTCISSAGTHTVPVLQSNASGYPRVNLTNYNTGSASTTEVDDLALNTTHTLLLLRFVREQVGFDGRPYSLQADVRGTVSRNVADEISRLLTVAGATPDATSFSAAQSYADTHGMLVDVDHGRGDDREGGQRTLRALLDDLLFIARATLSRNSAGTGSSPRTRPPAPPRHWTKTRATSSKCSAWTSRRSRPASASASRRTRATRPT